MQFGPWSVNAGLRWDRYDLVVTEHAFSPRLAAAWSRPAAALVVRASYDRAFQTPASENLLLASSPSTDELDDEVARLPVRPSRGHFYEMGISKGLFGNFRLDATVFSRTMTHAADDDLLLNTGVSFPIAFQRADVSGVELKLETPQWKRVSGFVGYGLMRAFADLPVTGGLFLGEEGSELLESDARLPSSQDQRHTVRGRLAYQLGQRGWVAWAAAYGSGLPFEDFAGDEADAVAQFGPRVVARVDFTTGRVKPSWSFDASAGLVLAKAGAMRVRAQVEVRNLTNRLNVINFAGLFSGTAIAAPRGVAIRLGVDF
jgi:outer membrane receptor protein involved in Fe transport